jgi:hypothetical protein
MKLLYLLILVFSSLILSGCFPKSTFSDKNVSVGTQFAKGGVVPKFPGVPIYPEVKIIESYSSGTNFGASAYSEDSLDKVVDFYSNSFMQLGWENSVNVQSANYYLFEFKSPQFRGTVIVNPAADNKSTAITIAVSSRQ